MAGLSPFNVIIFLSLNSLNLVKKHLGKTPLPRHRPRGFWLLQVPSALRTNLVLYWQVRVEAAPD